MTRRLAWFQRRTDQGHPYWLLAAQRRRAHYASAALYVDSNLFAGGHLSGGAAIEPQPGQNVSVDIHCHPDLDSAVRPAPLGGPPRACELLMCVLVDPEYQKDRLADYEERFAALWVPKFGRRAAVVVYVWHVLRQARFIDWIIRLLSNGSP